jgi:hypothetical protein
MFSLSDGAFGKRSKDSITSEVQQRIAEAMQSGDDAKVFEAIKWGALTLHPVDPEAAKQLTDMLTNFESTETSKTEPNPTRTISRGDITYTEVWNYDTKEWIIVAETPKYKPTDNKTDARIKSQKASLKLYGKSQGLTFTDQELENAVSMMPDKFSVTTTGEIINWNGIATQSIIDLRKGLAAQQPQTGSQQGQADGQPQPGAQQGQAVTEQGQPGAQQGQSVPHFIQTEASLRRQAEEAREIERKEEAAVRAEAQLQISDQSLQLRQEEAEQQNKATAMSLYEPLVTGMSLLRQAQALATGLNTGLAGKAIGAGQYIGDLVGMMEAETVAAGPLGLNHLLEMIQAVSWTSLVGGGQLSEADYGFIRSLTGAGLRGEAEIQDKLRLLIKKMETGLVILYTTYPKLKTWLKDSAVGKGEYSLEDVKDYLATQKENANPTSVTQPNSQDFFSPAQ